MATPSTTMKYNVKTETGNLDYSALNRGETVYDLGWGWGVVREGKLFVICWSGQSSGWVQSSLKGRAVKKTQEEIDAMLGTELDKAITLADEIDATLGRIESELGLSTEEQANLFGIEFDPRASVSQKPERCNTVARTYALGTYAP